MSKQTKELYKDMDSVIDVIEYLYEKAIELGLENEQRFLNWLDRINEISVRK